jgi:hypothetical protein
VSTEDFTGVPPVGILRRLFLVVAFLVGLGLVLAAVLGGAYLVETYLVV